MPLHRRIALAVLVAAGLAANLGSNFVAVNSEVPLDLYPVTAWSCTPGSVTFTTSGNGQTAVAGAPLALPLVVSATCIDTSSNLRLPVEGRVEWQVASGNGAVN